VTDVVINDLAFVASTTAAITSTTATQVVATTFDLVGVDAALDSARDFSSLEFLVNYSVTTQDLMWLKITFKRESDNVAVSTYKALMTSSSGEVLVHLDMKPEYVNPPPSPSRHTSITVTTYYAYMFKPSQP
jgi:hypothetical protein